MKADWRYRANMSRMPLFWANLIQIHTLFFLFFIYGEHRCHIHIYLIFFFNIQTEKQKAFVSHLLEFVRQK